MFLNLNHKNSKFKIFWKSNWFNQNSYLYKLHIYEDIFLRKYITSFLFKWTKFCLFKVIGSIYLFRTFGKLYINTYFFCPNKNFKNYPKKRILAQRLINFDLTKPKPLFKCRKHLYLFKFFFELEKILGMQVFFKFNNICNSLFINKYANSILNFMFIKFSIFKFKFNFSIYQNTILFLFHLFKFKEPDSTLFSNYISLILVSIQKHSYYLVFLKKVLHFIRNVFKFRGVRILFSGKLNSASRAKINHIQVGTISFQSFNLSFSGGYSEAFTNAGKIGIKVWIS